MIGAGIGITPFRALLESHAVPPGHATVILRGPHEEELYLGDEILRTLPPPRRNALPPDRAPAGRNPSWLPESAARSGHG